MACTHGRINPSPNTKLRLFADSGGYCANPTCWEEIFKFFEDEVIHIAEIAHIISAGDKGPRADTKLSDEERSRYENLILLCPTCHTIIDKAEKNFSKETLLEWKRSHKERLAAQFNITLFTSRQEARNAVLPLLRQNKFVFDKYGPLTDERFNPESSMPALWRKKIRENIIPNNRKILNITDANHQFLNEKELDTLEAFRQHVNDFEAKHLNDVEYSGQQFPIEMRDLFG